MLLSQAIVKNAGNLASAQQIYQQNVATVTSAMTGVSQTSLPALNYPPPNWAQFSATLIASKTNAQQWLDEVLVQLYSVPQNVESNYQAIQQAITTCAGYATSLQSNPDPSTLAFLQEDLQNIASQLGFSSAFISSCQQAVSSFNDGLPTLLSELDTLVTDFTDAEQVDQGQIAQFQSDISSLNADISSQESLIVGEVVMAGAALYVGRISGWTPVGCLVKFLCIATIAGATYGIDVAANQIAADKANIVNDTNQMNEYTADVATCVATVQVFTKFVNDMAAVASSVEAVLEQWNTFEADIKAAIADIKAALSDSENAAYSAALDDINAALVEWNAVDELAVNLTLSVNYSQADIQVGMTPAQVQTAVAGAAHQDIISYLTTSQAAAA
ncbi:hypothetical protein [Xylophilus ampelinus]|uniref:Hemolytic enterotoxin HBL n=1 Tax=Xylophilus ampelinus TaxID=54067 RepID=A0A318SLF1_9BURK|nr:hypothetical protein [Xylophilus ampelinus]MCS4508738.1 hypothetical protein [Xylophilus ampelinus]PYE79308.1 hypothetical protein DFQ15_10238 [Xylophilus ampelinus]